MNLIKNIIYTTLCVIALSSCCKDSDYVIRKIEVELVNGSKKVVKYKIPDYAGLKISSHKGSYWLSIWEDCGIAPKETVLMYGVVYYRVIE